MKECRDCQELKKLTEYYRNKQTPDGRMYQCKECAKEQARDRYWENPERERSRARKYYHANPERSKARCKRWYQETKGKFKIEEIFEPATLEEVEVIEAEYQASLVPPKPDPEITPTTMKGNYPKDHRPTAYHQACVQYVQGKITQREFHIAFDKEIQQKMKSRRSEMKKLTDTPRIWWKPWTWMRG